MANLTPAEYAAKLESKLNSLKTNDKAMGVAVFDTNAKMVNRIFVQGRDSSNSGIGSYNTTDPLYVNPKYSPKSFPTKGKAGNSRKKNGEAYKTAYFSSYKAFRDTIGRETGFVNLTLFGLLQNSVSNGIERNSNGRYITILKGEQGDKADGLEKKYGTIFNLTKEERENFLRVYEFEITKLLNA